MSQLVKGIMMVRCSDPNHTNCSPITHAVEKLDKSVHAYSTKAKFGNRIYCVTVTTTHTPTQLRALQRKIERIRVGNTGLHVAEVKAFQDRR